MRLTWVTVLIVLMLWALPTFAGEVFTDDFASGVGHFDRTTGNGDNAFVWDATTESIDAIFSRSDRTDRRYALVGGLAQVTEQQLRFEATVTPIAAGGNTSGIFANARIGLFDSQGTNAADMLGVEFRQLSGGQPEFVVRGAYSDGTRILLGTPLNFEYETTYFVDSLLDGPAGVFQADLYEGFDSSGGLVGTVVVALDQSRSLQFDAFGLSNVRGDHDRQMELSLHSMSYIPEPATVSLLALGGVALLRRRGS